MTTRFPGLWLHRYRPGATLGRGAHGTVYLSTDNLLGDTVAIKAIPMVNPARTARIRREIAALRVLQIPGVVPLRDEGMHGELQLIVMDRIDGRPFPGRSGPIPWEHLKDQVLKVLDVLEVVHASGIVHQDLKPSNILMDREGQPHLLDFGLASGAGVGLRRGKTTGGTPRYAAPEQLLEQKVGPSTDLYALGIVIWEALTGNLPHPDDGVVSRLFKPPERLQAEVSDLLEELLLAMLHRDPDQRPASATEVAAILREGEQIHLPAVPDPADEHSLQQIFHGPSRVLHLPERAAGELLRRAGSDRTQLLPELNRWVQTGVAVPEDGRLRVSLEGLRRIRLLPGQRAALPDIDLSPAAFARSVLDEAPRGAPDSLLGQVRELRELGHPEQAIERLEAISNAFQEASARRAMMVLWIDAAMAMGTQRALQRVLIELQRGPTDPWHISAFSMVRALLLANRGEMDRAEMQQRRTQASPDLALPMRATEVRIAAAQPARIPALLRSLAEEAQRPVAHRWLLHMWMGMLHYHRGESHLAALQTQQAVRLAPTPAARFPAGINAVSALILADDLPAAEALTTTLLEEARGRRFAEYEARAEAHLRAIRYRQRAPLYPDLELVHALEHLELPDVLGLVALTESAFAWRTGDPALREQVVALAQIAERALKPLDAASSALSSGLKLLNQRQRPPKEALAPLLKEAARCTRPMIQAQIIGLVWRMSEEPEPLRAQARAIVGGLTALPEPPDPTVRREVLSLDECAGW